MILILRILDTENREHTKFSYRLGIKPLSHSIFNPSKILSNVTCYYSLDVCIFGFKGASTSKVIGARNEMMMMDDYDGQMIFGDLTRH